VLAGAFFGAAGAACICRQAGWRYVLYNSSTNQKIAEDESLDDALITLGHCFNYKTQMSPRRSLNCVALDPKLFQHRPAANTSVIVCLAADMFGLSFQSCGSDRIERIKPLCSFLSTHVMLLRKCAQTPHQCFPLQAFSASCGGKRTNLPLENHGKSGICQKQELGIALQRAEQGMR